MSKPETVGSRRIVVFAETARETKVFLDRIGRALHKFVSLRQPPTIIGQGCKCGCGAANRPRNSVHRTRSPRFRAGTRRHRRERRNK